MLAMRSSPSSRLARRSVGAVALAMTGALLVACSDSSGTDDGGPPASMEVVGGNGQQGVVGEELADPLVVKVTDDRGRPVRGQLVNWRVTAGGGSVFAGSALTNREGVAQERWTLGTVAGAAQRVEARAVDDVTGAALVFATFEATAEPGPATTLEPTVDGPLAAPVGAALPAPITARATDRFDNPVPGVAVTWTPSGGGSADPAASATDAEGEASTTWTLGSGAGEQSLVASSGSLEPARFTATAGAGTPVRLEILAGNEREAEVGATIADALEVRALDAFDNPVPGVAVTWAVTSGGGDVTPLAATTDGAGIVKARWTLGTAAGAQTAAASAEGVADAPFAALALAAAPAAVTIVSGDDQEVVVGEALPEPLVVRVTDRYANPTPDVAIAWAVTTGGGSIAPDGATTDDVGRASARWTIGSIGDGNRVTATAAPGVAATLRATGLLGGGGRLEQAGLTHRSAPPGCGPGCVYSLYEARVRLLGAGGAPIANAEVTWTATGGGSAAPSSTRTDGAGFAATEWRLGTMVGENTLTARSLDAEPATFRIATTPASLCSADVRFEDGSWRASGKVGTLIEMPVYARSADQFGNPVGGYSPNPYPSPTDFGQRIEGSLATDASGQSAPAYVRVGSTVGTQELRFHGYACQGTSFGLLTPRLQTYAITIEAVP